MTHKIDEAMNRVATDYELERAEHPIGQLVHLSTVTHAWRGRLAAVTPSYYVLDNTAPVALVDSTGGIAEYLAAPKAGETVAPPKRGSGPTIRIPRGAVAWMVSWPEAGR